jgi:Flagellar assembly protein T, C-terminal domain
VRKQTPSKRRVLASVLVFCAFGAGAASAQTVDGQAGRREPERPASLQPAERARTPVARDSETACGGFIEQTPQASSGQLVGSTKETERRSFAQGDMVFIDAGAQAGVRVGQEFEVVRPRGRFSSKFSKKGSLGVFTQEVGRLRVVRVRDRVSVAEVTQSCSDLLLGDLLRPYARPVVPPAREEGVFDVFAEPSGKQTGRIVLARDGREEVTRDDVVYIDLGAEDNLKVGDRLTVFRPKGHGTIVHYGGEIGANSRRDFQSNELQGGGFSIQAQRVSDVGGPKSGSSVKTPDIKRRRPPVPRHVVGEMVVIRVEGRTATAVVTRTAQEIFTGDAVEVQ